MWKQNFMFRHQDSTPLKESENELFHDTDPALDSAGLQLEKFISVWIQGDGRDAALGESHDGIAPAKCKAAHECLGVPAADRVEYDIESATPCKLADLGAPVHLRVI